MSIIYKKLFIGKTFSLQLNWHSYIICIVLFNDYIFYFYKNNLNLLFLERVSCYI